MELAFGQNKKYNLKPNEVVREYHRQTIKTNEQKHNR